MCAQAAFKFYDKLKNYDEFEYGYTLKVKSSILTYIQFRASLGVVLIKSRYLRRLLLLSACTHHAGVKIILVRNKELFFVTVYSAFKA